MIYYLSSINSTLLNVAHIIANSNSIDSNRTSWIGVFGVIISAIISMLVNLYIFHRESNKENDHINQRRKITENHLHEKLSQNRKDMYNNSLRIYIYKKMDRIVNKLISIWTKSTALNGKSKSLLDEYEKIHNIVFIKFANSIIKSNANMINKYLHFVDGAIFRFMIIIDSLKSLNDLPIDIKFKDVKNKLDELDAYMINDDNNVPDNSDKKSQINMICKNTGKISDICTVLIPRMSYINEYHSLHNTSTNIEKDLKKYMSNKSSRN